MGFQTAPSDSRTNVLSTLTPKLLPGSTHELDEYMLTVAPSRIQGGSKCRFLKPNGVGLNSGSPKLGNLCLPGPLVSSSVKWSQ